MINITLRNEVPRDIAMITSLTYEAFSKPNYEPTEHLIVNALREMGALTFSIVAEAAGEVIGHVAFSPATISDGRERWYALGPISVLPALQLQGIGSALVLEGLARLEKMGAAGCLLLGNPRYYGRFGFRSVDGLSVRGVPPEHLQIVVFDGDRPRGEVSFHPGFSVTR